MFNRPPARPAARRSQPSRWMPEALSRALSSLFARIAGGVVLALSLAVFLALVSHTPADTSLNAASDQQIGNLLGFGGSIFADLIWQTFGTPGIFLAFVLASWGWRIGNERGIDLFWGRCLAALIAILAAGLALAAIAPTSSLDQTHLWSGALAKTMIAPLRPWLPSVWGGRIIAGGMALLSLGALYMAAALTFEEWQTLGRTIKEFSRRLTHKVLDTVYGAWMALRHGRQDVDDDDDPIDESEETTAPPGRAEPQRIKPEKNAPKPIVRKPAKVSRQPRLALSSGDDYTAPPLDLLQWPNTKNRGQDDLSSSALEKNAKLLESVLADFGVFGHITRVNPGPVVTLYELEPSPGTRSSRIISLADDIARNMSAASVRVAVVQGRNVIGIELPNKKRETVYLRELMSSEAYTDNKGFLPLVLGKDIAGEPIIADLSRMPHLLIAGTTGSGKSVAINTMILSLLYRLSPEKCRFIMIDPKVLELSVYEGIPHLLAPVVTEPKKAIVALKWAVREMDERYNAMAKLSVRNIEGYNIRLREAAKNNESLTRTVQTGFDRETGKPIYEEQPLDLTPLPYIVVIVDEMADLMLVAGKDIEGSIQRLAQKARAAGIHLIMATQRPSVDVITGTIKANFPNRVSFQVTSKIDSRTILGEQGAEQLLGLGDMLFMAGGSRVIRVHGPFVADEEVESAVSFLKEQGDPDYRDDITKEEEALEDEAFGGGGDSGDELYDKAVDAVLRGKKASISFVQRQLKIGYNRAATLIERMEKEGLISQADHVGRREILGRSASGEEEVD